MHAFDADVEVEILQTSPGNVNKKYLKINFVREENLMCVGAIPRMVNFRA